MAAPAYSQDDYRSALQALLPRGRVWPRNANSVQTSTLAGFAASFARSNGAAIDLLMDAFPSSTVNLLAEWESTVGLPDTCAGLQPTIQARRTQMLSRLTSLGGQSIAYFTALAAALGYSITVTQFAPSRFGRPFGAQFGGVAWAYAWQVNAASYVIQKFRFGADVLGEPFAAWGSTVMQCELQAAAPAHTTLNFNYTS
ncbi:MAG: YmfQ family protein [Betaproteobacteria bacterium]|nr:YmfQ family protein [Betaproteobacteria bacterium]